MQLNEQNFPHNHFITDFCIPFTSLRAGECSTKQFGGRLNFLYLKIFSCWTTFLNIFPHQVLRGSGEETLRRQYSVYESCDKWYGRPQRVHRLASICQVINYSFTTTSYPCAPWCCIINLLGFHPHYGAYLLLLILTMQPRLWSEINAKMYAVNIFAVCLKQPRRYFGLSLALWTWIVLNWMELRSSRDSGECSCSARILWLILWSSSIF